MMESVRTYFRMLYIRVYCTAPTANAFKHVLKYIISSSHRLLRPIINHLKLERHSVLQVAPSHILLPLGRGYFRHGKVVGAWFPNPVIFDAL
jgi:hypothetical protein